MADWARTQFSRLQRWFGAPASGRQFLPITLGLMGLFYALLYHGYSEASLPARVIGAYLDFVAQASGAVLRWMGETIDVQGTAVYGRFPFVVVLDCAALDAQALFAAAVLAFPVSWRDKCLGLGFGLSAICCINTGRLVFLYFAGAYSLDLFRVLHEEVFVLLVILGVCALFALWARWAHAHVNPAAASGASRAA